MAKQTRAFPAKEQPDPAGTREGVGRVPSVETAVPSRNLPAVWQEGASRAGGEAGASSRGKEGGRGLGHQTLRVTEAVRVWTASGWPVKEAPRHRYGGWVPLSQPGQGRVVHSSFLSDLGSHFPLCPVKDVTAWPKAPIASPKDQPCPIYR